jgi:hypothetical protein
MPEAVIGDPVLLGDLHTFYLESAFYFPRGAVQSTFALFCYLKRHASIPEKFPVHSSEFELHLDVSSYARLVEQQAKYAILCARKC